MPTPRRRSNTATGSGPGASICRTPRPPAAALIGMADRERPLHVGALLGNTPDMLTALAAAALGGYVLCGINDTRRGAALAKDIRRADCQILLVDPAHRVLLDDLELPGVRVVDTPRDEWAQLLAAAGPLVPHREVVPTDTLHDDLHLGHQRRAQGRPGHASDRSLRRRQPGWPIRRRLIGRLLPVDAAVSLQRGARRLERGGRLRRGDGARPASRRPASCRTSAATARPT